MQIKSVCKILTRWLFYRKATDWLSELDRTGTSLAWTRVGCRPLCPGMPYGNPSCYRAIPIPDTRRSAPSCFQSDSSQR